MQNVLVGRGSFWMHPWQRCGFSEWLVVGTKGLELDSSLRIYLRWLRMKQKHVLNSFMSLELWIPLLEDNASDGVHSCFWDECYLFQVYLVGSLIPPLNHCQPNVHFPGMGCLRMTSCAQILPPLGDGDHMACSSRTTSLSSHDDCNSSSIHAGIINAFIAFGSHAEC